MRPRKEMQFGVVEYKNVQDSSRGLAWQARAPDPTTLRPRIASSLGTHDDEVAGCGHYLPESPPPTTSASLMPTVTALDRRQFVCSSQART